MSVVSADDGSRVWRPTEAARFVLAVVSVLCLFVSALSLYEAWTTGAQVLTRWSGWLAGPVFLACAVWAWRLSTRPRIATHPSGRVEVQGPWRGVAFHRHDVARVRSALWGSLTIELVDGRRITSTVNSDGFGDGRPEWHAIAYDVSGHWPEDADLEHS